MQVDWYSDFYYPFLKRWGERIRSITSADKLVFSEAIPNDVRGDIYPPVKFLTMLLPCSFALRHGLRINSCPTWFTDLIGK